MEIYGLCCGEETKNKCRFGNFSKENSILCTAMKLSFDGINQTRFVEHQRSTIKHAVAL